MIVTRQSLARVWKNHFLQPARIECQASYLLKTLREVAFRNPALGESPVLYCLYGAWQYNLSSQLTAAKECHTSYLLESLRKHDSLLTQTDTVRETVIAQHLQV